MKFLVTWDNRWGGHSAADFDADSQRLLDAFAKWEPPASVNIITMLERLDGSGGYAIFETDNPADVAEAPSKFGAWLDFKVIPVMDLVESIGIVQEGMAYRQAV
jgi:hypothetical protein